ncbi:MAG: hypothetical protein L6V93_13695 [Clostridiales bacterium]|nr:MAG: hypothetical protein L6V93_13695 [Clostridiales bacterium]
MRKTKCSSAFTARHLPKKAEMQAYLDALEEAKKRDHRKTRQRAPDSL